jgi:hypothetical protein
MRAGGIMMSRDRRLAGRLGRRAPGAAWAEVPRRQVVALPRGVAGSLVKSEDSDRLTRISSLSGLGILRFVEDSEFSESSGTFGLHQGVGIRPSVRPMRRRSSTERRRSMPGSCGLL